MRVHTRGKGRYFRTVAGDMVLDWGSNGADYSTLDFSYVAECKGGLRTIYGQVRRNSDGETYDTYDIMAGRKRLKTSKNSTIEHAIKAHITAVTGVAVPSVSVRGEMPVVPDTIKPGLEEVLLKAVSGWDDFWDEECRGWTEERREIARKRFVNEVKDVGKFYIDSMANKKTVVALGLMNVEVGEYSNLYRLWKDFCGGLGHEHQRDRGGDS